MPAIDGQHNLIQRPLVSTAGLPTVPLVGESLAELQAPPANGLVGDEDAAGGPPFFHVAVAQREPKIQPHGVADDLGRIAVAVMERLGGVHGHAVFRFQPATLNLTAPSIKTKLDARPVHRDGQRRMVPERFR